MEQQIVCFWLTKSMYSLVESEPHVFSCCMGSDVIRDSSDVIQDSSDVIQDSVQSNNMTSLVLGFWNI